MIRACLAVLGFVAVAAAPVWAQEDVQRGGYSAILDNLDAMVDGYARMVARKYDLTDEQAEITAQMLRGKANDFLSRHDSEVRQLLDEMFHVRTGGSMSQEGLVQWGQRVLPLYNEAKDALIRGNAEFREILTEEQRRIHDQDLGLMEQSLQTTDEQVRRIVSGEMPVEEFRSPPRFRGGRSARSQAVPAPVVANAPTPDVPDDEPRTAPVEDNPQPERPRIVTPRPARNPAQPTGPSGQPMGQGGEVQQPAGTTNPPVVQEAQRERGRVVRGGESDKPGRGPLTTPSVKPDNWESEWEKYVREFTARYELNEDQSGKAKQILLSCQNQGQRYMSGKSATIAALDKDIAALAQSKDKDKTKLITEKNAEKQKLMEPLTQIFEKQLKPRLDKLPTRAQRKAAEAADKKANPARGVVNPKRDKD